MNFTLGVISMILGETMVIGFSCTGNLPGVAFGIGFIVLGFALLNKSKKK